MGKFLIEYHFHSLLCCRLCSAHAEIRHEVTELRLDLLVNLLALLFLRGHLLLFAILTLAVLLCLLRRFSFFNLLHFLDLCLLLFG